MNIPLPNEGRAPTRLADADSLPLVSADEEVLRVVAARFPRTRLSHEELRDIKLLVFAMEIETGRLAHYAGVGQALLPPAVEWPDRASRLTGVGRHRLELATRRLVESEVLVANDTVPGRLALSPAVVRPIGIAQYVDWSWVVGQIAGRVPALLILRAFLDQLRHPAEWTSCTYEVLAEHACYSVGMAQRGASQLLMAGVLERSTHVGRGHDYRLTPGALGHRAPDQATATPTELPPPAPVAVQSAPSAQRVAAQSPLPAPAQSSMVVEIGGLVVRVPEGTEIRMGIQPDGLPFYQVGPDLKIRRGSPE